MDDLPLIVNHYETQDIEKKGSFWTSTKNFYLKKTVDSANGKLLVRLCTDKTSLFSNHAIILIFVGEVFS